MADFPDIAIPDQFADGVANNAAALDAYTTHQLNKLVGRLTDGGWAALTVTNTAWTGSTAAGLSPQWRQVGPHVSLMGVVSPNNITGSTAWSLTVATLPAGARPVGQWIVKVTNPNASVSVEMKVDTDGTIQFRSVGASAIPAGSSISIATTFLAG